MLQCLYCGIFSSPVWGLWLVHNCTLKGIIHMHILCTNTAMHPCTNTFAPKFLRLSLGFLHQTAHQVHFLYSNISAFHWREKMTTSSHYNSTRSWLLCHPFCMPPISLHFFCSLSNKTPIHSSFFALLPYPFFLSCGLFSLLFEGNLFINLIPGNTYWNIHTCWQITCLYLAKLLRGCAPVVSELNWELTSLQLKFSL